MSKFINFTAYERVGGTEKDYRLTDDLFWDIGKKGGHKEVLPKGFIFQVSSPRFYDWLQRKLPFLPNLAHHPWLLIPSAIHDWFLINGYDLPFSSGEFRRSMRAKGANVLFAICAYFLTLIWTVIGQELRDIQHDG